MIPADRRYTKAHDWVKIEGDTAMIGITDHAQEQLGDITFIELPQAGAEVEVGGELTVIESVKAAIDVYSPLAGTITEVNEALADAPEKLNGEPYAGGWICKLSGFDAGTVEGLMDAEAYKSLLESE